MAMVLLLVSWLSVAISTDEELLCHEEAVLLQTGKHKDSYLTRSTEEKANSEEAISISPWCFKKSCKSLKAWCLAESKCCDVAKRCHVPGPSPSPSSLIGTVKEAFNSDAGVMVSAADSYVLKSDLSGTIMRKSLRQGLYNGPGSSPFDDNMGVIFPPAAADHPKAICAYTIDSGTQHRKNTAGDQDRCGKYPNSNATIQDVSGACASNGVSTPEEYANFYYLSPVTPAGSVPGINWQVQKANCHFNTSSEAIDSQQALWQKLAEEISEEDFNKLLSGPSFYNEIVLADSPEYVNGLPPIVAYFWGHDGDFMSPADYDASTSNDGKSAICCIAQQFCPSPPDVPLIEIAQQVINTGFDRQQTFEQLQAYKDAVDVDGGYDADKIFREVPWEELCDQAFLSTCQAPATCVQP